MSILRKISLTVFILTVHIYAGATGFGANAISGVSPLSGSSIKLIPALFSNTYGLQGEYVINGKLSVGLNAFVYIPSRTISNPSILTGEYLENGAAIDLFAKYYFIGDAPSGVYFYANVSYNSIVYFDGNTRPYTIHNNWRNLDDIANPEVILRADPFNGGVGIGYQTKIVNHLIADFTFGIQAQSHPDDGFFISLYVLPAIGYVF